MNRTKLSITQAVESLRQFLLENVPDGTEVEVTQAQADDIARMAANVTAYGDGQPIDMDLKRERYEAVGWLTATLSGWFDESHLENWLLDRWAVFVLEGPEEEEEEEEQSDD